MIPWKEYFSKPTGPQTARMIIGWWELRRFYYNVIIFAAILLISLVLPVFLKVNAISSASTYLGSLGYHVVLSFLLLQVPANIWYTGGWVADLLIKKVLHLTALGFGPWAQGIGIAFSLIFVVYMMGVTLGAP